MQNCKAYKYTSASLSIKSLFCTRFERRKYLVKLIESLIRRLNAIINGEGNHIKY
jgi:hypothetical protein